MKKIKISHEEAKQLLYRAEAAYNAGQSMEDELDTHKLDGRVSDNIFCSQECICEHLSVISVI